MTMGLFIFPVKENHNFKACKDILYYSVLPVFWQLFGKEPTDACEVKCPHTFGHPVYQRSSGMFSLKGSTSNNNKKKPIIFLK